MQVISLLLNWTGVSWLRIMQQQHTLNERVQSKLSKLPQIQNLYNGTCHEYKNPHEVSYQVIQDTGGGLIVKDGPSHALES